MTEPLEFDITLPGQRPSVSLPDHVTADMIRNRHINDGVTLTGGITDVATAPAIHKVIGGIVNANNQIPRVNGPDPLYEFRDSKLAEFIDPVAPADYDPYRGRDPKRFLGIRRFILNKTVRMAINRERGAEDDMLTGFHLADTIQRAAPSFPAYSSAGLPGRRGSIDTDSKSAMTEYRRQVGTRINADGEVEPIYEQPFKGTEGGIVVEEDGTVTVIKNRGREAEFVESSRKQTRHANKLTKKRKKWRHATHRAHELHDSYKHLSHAEVDQMSRKNRRMHEKGVEKAHDAHKHEDKRREKYVKLAYKPAHEHRKAASKRMRREAKLAAVERSIASR